MNQIKSNSSVFYPNNNQIRPLGPPLPPPQSQTTVAPINSLQAQSLYLANQQLIQNTIISNQLTPNGSYAQPIIYWYPTPPVSPTQKLIFHPQPPSIVHSVSSPSILILKGAPVGITVSDILAIFHGYEVYNQKLLFKKKIISNIFMIYLKIKILPEYIQIQNNTESYLNGLSTVDVLITFFNRSEAERACIEKNHLKIGSNTIELYLAI